MFLKISTIFIGFVVFLGVLVSTKSDTFHGDQVIVLESSVKGVSVSAQRFDEASVAIATPLPTEPPVTEATIPQIVPGVLESFGKNLSTVVDEKVPSTTVLVAPPVTHELIEVAPLGLANTPRAWVEYVKQNVFPKLLGSFEEKVEKAALVTWWGLKEGNFHLSNPLAFSLCNFPNGDARIGLHDVCPGDIWAVGIVGAQVKYLGGQAESVATLLYPGVSFEDILESTAVEAGLSTNDVNIVRNSSGELRNSWLLRNSAIAYEIQYAPVKNECFGESPRSWCFGSKWDTSRMYAADQTASLKVVEDLKRYFRGEGEFNG